MKTWYHHFRDDVIKVVVGAFILMVLFEVGGCFRDETDAEDGPRSGVSLRIDHGTGCHYLESTKGYLVPRLDKSGKQVCK